MFEALYEFFVWLATWLDHPFTKLVSYVVGPILALVSFAYGMRERSKLQRMIARLVKYNRRLGQAKEQVRQEASLVAEMRRELNVTKTEVNQQEKSVARLRAELEGITKGSAQLWKLRPNQPFADYKSRLRDPVGARIVTFANLKGGVGKTTLAANFAAYVSETLEKPVLVVDLDYQGSLSNMMMLAAEQEIERSEIDDLLKDGADLSTLTRIEKHLSKRLKNAWLVPASFTLAEVENQLLLHWLLNETSAIDVRYRLAHVLLNPDVRRRFAAIIIDTPPRMSIGTVNALIASHHFVVPSTLDALGARAVPQFVGNMKAIKGELDLDLELVGVVGMMSRAIVLAPRETKALDAIREGAMLWKAETDFVIPHVLPKRVGIADAAGDDIAYLGTTNGEPLKVVFDPLFADIAERIMLTNR